MTETGYVHRLHAGAPDKPILLVLHGTGGDENQFFDFGRRLLPEATILSPRGDVSEHGAARFFRRTGEGVYDMPDLSRATEKMAAYVKAFADEHQASHILGLGFSNGANILANVLIEKGIFDAAVLMHPLIPFQPEAQSTLAGRKVLMTAGQRDPIAPASMTEALSEHLKNRGAEIRVVWHPGGHEIAPLEINAVRDFLGGY
ncbi:alpha/beta hydrolase [Rhizobium leguminosarum]|uniref:alpha/beta hydrolase n=1 Tax=Rhizobium leguminosarum TaxID=384 RepID=UPI001A92AD8C|nr:alpha/beta hydrolase [Rhizobium leguminosarum]MBY5557521.1 alpha/beta hydrolase [Rhizobium leguminosarum]MBY5636181.1 alpha/beta hydrolase [Rhizobium leguminosarum]MBY5688237.1 alpha/beta hydrolase [Rhizobium leguminosarum]MBY5727180.1 alpha/beta hydrolase [Rhizobium leguminosarum]MBY5742755.1 alpha/beta hydrolase [Rhizobium leguminosarum]